MESLSDKVRKKVRAIKGSLEMSYEDEKNRHIFTVSDINAYSYDFCSFDYDLTVDVVISGKNGEEPEFHRDIPLGNAINSKPRESISFGEEYYDAVSPELNAIVKRELKKDNDEFFENYRKSIRSLRGAPQKLFGPLKKIIGEDIY